jgi:ABC-2 type transport system ATP-binding protein
MISMVESEIISVNNLKKYFDEVKAVNGISFTVYRGEVFGLLGPNGAGKTTTIKLLLGLLEPLEGEIKVLGMNPERDEIKIKSRVGYVSEEPLIFKSLTPKDLFNFIASIRQLDEEEASIKVKEYLDSLEATEYYNQLIATLSHGNKQKMQIIASILHEPDLLILDEPLSGLDAKSVRVVKEILNLHTERGGSVVFSTHIMELAEELCDRIAIINKGKIVGIGTIEELEQQANKLGSRLEEVFLRLTEQDASVDEIVKKLRKSYKTKIKEKE